MNDSPLHQFGLQLLQSHKIDFKKNDKAFVDHFFAHIDEIEFLFNQIYNTFHRIFIKI